MNKTVSLVLSGGGARGYAHIGVIDVLKKRGYKIKSISGTSMGAVIGGLEACGKLNEYRQWIATKTLFDVAKMIDFNFKSGLSKGLIKGEAMFSYIKELLGDIKIEELPIKFTAVAVNLTRQKEVWYQSGDLYHAIRASSAIPGIFVPVVKDNELIVDGGVLNNVPIAPTMSDDTELTVVVNVNSNRENIYPIHSESSKFERFWTRTFDFSDDPKGLAINMMMDYIEKYRMAEYTADLTINISKDLCGVFDFHKNVEIIEVGKKIAEEELDNFEKGGF